MGGVERNQSHTAQVHAFMDAVNDVITDLVVGGVAPPGQDIGLVQDFFRQTMLRLIHRRRADGKALTAQVIGDDRVHAIGIHFVYAFSRVADALGAESIILQARLDIGMALRVLMPVFIPNGHSNRR